MRAKDDMFRISQDDDLEASIEFLENHFEKFFRNSKDSDLGLKKLINVLGYFVKQSYK